MVTLKDYVNFKLTHADKTAESNGYPLVMENCKKNKRMKQLEIYGNSAQDGTPTPENPIEVQSVGELVTDSADVNCGKYKIPVVQRGINYHDYKKFNYKEQTINGITFTPLGDGSFHLKGKLEDTTKLASYRVVIWNAIPVKAGTYHSKRHSSTDITVMFGSYKKNGTQLININSSSNSGNATLSEDGYIGYCQIYVRANVTREIDDIVYPQLTKGTQNLPYEPYIEPITTNVFLNEPLRKIGDYADYIDFKNKKVVRNTFVRVYDGVANTNNPFAKGDNEANWIVNSDVNENFWIYNLNDTLPIIPKYGHADFKHPPICSQLPIICRVLYADADLGKINEECIWFVQNAMNVKLFLSKNRVDGTSTALRNFLKENPLRVTIATYEPIEESITADLPKLNAKTTVIEVDTSLAPSNAKGKYIKR